MPIIGDTQIQPVNFLEQYMRGQEFARGRRVNEQAEQLNALKLQAAEREQSNALALQQALARGATDEDLMRLPGGAQLLEQKYKARRERTGAATAGIERRIKAADFLAQSAGSWLRMPNLNKAQLAPWVAEMVENDLISPEAAARFEQMPDDPAMLAQGLQMLQLAGVDSKEQLEQHFTPQNLGGRVRLIATPKFGGGPARVVQGSEATVTMTPYEQNRIALERQQEARLAAAGLVKGTPEYEAAVTTARKGAEADVAFREGFPTAVRTAERTLSLLDTMLGDLDVSGNELMYRSAPKGQAPRRPAKGFETAVGASILPGARFIPGTSAADFQAMHDQATGASFMEAFATLKGGGQITEKEGEKATAALNRMNLAQSEREYIRAAREFQAEVKRVLETARERFNRAPPAAGGGNSVFDEADAIIGVKKK